MADIKENGKYKRNYTSTWTNLEVTEQVAHTSQIWGDDFAPMKRQLR